MPLAKPQPDIFPADLLDRVANSDGPAGRWWVLYTRSRREKQLSRHLLARRIPFYCPTVARRFRSPSGRLRICQDPLFRSYVFLRGDGEQKDAALSSNCVSQYLPVEDPRRLTHDLGQIRRLIATGHPLTPESRLPAGAQVRVTSGAFAGFEGIILRRQNEVRLLVRVEFMNGGASVLLEDCQLESVA